MERSKSMVAFIPIKLDFKAFLLIHHLMYYFDDQSIINLIFPATFAEQDRNQCVIESFRICFRQSPFYVLRPKTVCFPNQKHTVSEPRTYGFGTETIKGCLLNREYVPSVNLN